jgi:cytochrome c
MKSSFIKVVGFTAALAAFGAPAMADGDADAGKKVFNKCRACHTLEEGKNKVGPSLHGVIGRPAASIDGFKYSSAMKDSGLTWDEATLAEFLKKPKALVAKTRMSFAGLKKEDDIENVIAYIKANGG